MALAVISACQLSGAPPDVVRVVEDSPVLIIHDGDTMDVISGTEVLTIRLLGLNAPEVDECFANESRDHLDGLVGGKAVSVHIFGTDQFGRSLGVVYVDGLDLNQAQVFGGFAIATTPDSTVDYVEDEARAIDRSSGLWSSQACGSGPLPELGISVSSRDEIVTVINPGSETVDLAGFTMRDESSRHRFRFDRPTELEPGQSLEIASSHPGWDPGEPNVWNNDGDIAILMDELGTVVAHERY